jgi:hypothetical protein
MDSFKEFCINEGLGNMIRGVGNYLSKVNYDDEYWQLPQELKDLYDQNPEVRKYAAQLKQAKGVTLANALQTYNQERPAARQIAGWKRAMSPERNPGHVQNAPFAFGQYGNQPGWKRYQQ